MTADREPQPLLDVAGVSKAYRGVVACDDVSFDVGTGEIHALLGENGAGKSTLVKIIYGMVRPDEGAMRLAGALHAPGNPADARASGIGMIFQHFSLFEALTVSENVALGLATAVDAGDGARRTLADRIVSVARGYGFDLEPGRQVGRLSVGERQRVEIVRCLLADPRLIIMDEPTSMLSPIEVETLFQTLRALAREGRSILYISHKLEEIRQLCDRATVLRAGRTVATCRPRDETAKSLAEMMLGDRLSTPHRRLAATTVNKPDGEAVPSVTRHRFVIDRLSVASDDPFGVSLVDVSLTIAAGEIVGIAGVAGNGQAELMAALIGETPGLAPAVMSLDGRPIGDLGPARRRTAGLAAVPEQRLGHGAVPDMALSENAILTSVGERPGDRPGDRPSGEHRTRDTGRSRGGFIDRAGASRLATGIVGAFGVRAGGNDQSARTLSGGNLQKFIVGRELMRRPAVFIAAQPTWGVDAGAAAFIHAQVLELAASGAAVLLISQDLDELLALCDRIAVLAGGRLTAAEPVATLSLESIARRMGGAAATGDRR